jgi:hypothetical protein
MQSCHLVISEILKSCKVIINKLYTPTKHESGIIAHSLLVIYNSEGERRITLDIECKNSQEKICF